ncbi:hypothetical protein BBW65_06575 [Helicobacter enhydrae]|uniref:Uncharacterized protein n=1 Tax=Helicobacter enhydrae TaxID=222136 RepID=A0A1B1U708_9HELI|nr:hypothetical protein [Helicobacter enhydrae]ANV98482.1 hypothetical protein BBW65_06575 [Helicobacter enhydrae]
MNKTILTYILCLGFLVAQEEMTNPSETLQTLGTTTMEDKPKQSFIERMKEKERQNAVPRETVPVEESKFLIDTPIPKTAHYLPFLQTLLNIEPGTLPNPIGVSVIGSFTDERYTITKFRGTIGKDIGGALVRGLQPSIAGDKQKIIQAIKNSNLPLYIRIPAIALVNNIAKGDLATLKLLQNTINNTLGAGEATDWQLSEGKIHTKTGAVGIKTDVFLFPFMNLFFTGAYLNVQQSTNVGNATIPLKKPLGKLTSITFPVGTLSNDLDGYLLMGGTNLMVGYKGFFASFMVSGGYVRLDDLKNNIAKFVEKPFMYLAPRIGYSYHGIFTTHVGVQRIELFGETKGSDLSQITGGLVEGYSVEIQKFPVNFVAGAQFMFMRDLGLSVEYVGSPDVNGFNAEIAYRF